MFTVNMEVPSKFYPIMGQFKNKLMEEVSKELGVEYKVYSPPYRPQSNGRIESFHYFLKACIAKHITPQLEWDDVVPLACAAHNFFPNEHSRESPFFLMFEETPYYHSQNYSGPNCDILAMKRVFYHWSLSKISIN